MYSNAGKIEVAKQHEILARIDAVRPWNSPSFISFRCNRVCAANQTLEKKKNEKTKKVAYVCKCKLNVCFIMSDVAQSRCPILDWLNND